MHNKFIQRKINQANYDSIFVKKKKNLNNITVVDLNSKIKNNISGL